MKKIILLTLLATLLAGCSNDKEFVPHQWVCFRSAPTFDKIKIKPEEAEYVSQNKEEEAALERMVREKWGVKAEPTAWTLHSRCSKVKWKPEPKQF